MPVSYEPADPTKDDYRCFVIDPGLSEVVPVSAVSVRPGNALIVHHATVFVVPPEEANALHALDGADSRAGYSCFGGVGVATAYAAGAWVPGLTPVPPPRQNLGGWLLPKWLMVLQVHYNFDNAQSGSATDRSSVVAWRSTLPITEVPAVLTLGDWAFDLPAGQSDISRSVAGDVISASGTAQLGQVTEGLIYSAWAHEHLLGKAFRMDLIRADGSSHCLLHIPKWDFHWQSVYPFKTPIAAQAGDRVQVTCEWDNSPDRYPPGVPPHDVHYGETTADEMCIGTLAVMHF
jgi:hypothetical protein